VSGAATANQVGVYGTMGVASPLNVPGSRNGSASWTDSSGRFWLFSGSVYDPNFFLPGQINDLWRYDGANWTWMAGGSAIGQVMPVYGTKGVAAAGNIPGARIWSSTWTDHSGNLWLFGGTGYDSTGNRGELNDLWKFNGSAWAWMAGSNVIGAAGVYGNKGVAGPSNTPGARQIAASATDPAGNLWLFGGETQSRQWNDLWKWNGTRWTWVSGATVTNTEGVWGTKGTAAATNVVNARSGSALWIDSANRFWLFGGYGPFQGGVDNFNDLWKFDGTTWTWVAGTNLLGQPGVMGTKGVADPASTPGARSNGTRWIDSSNNLWFFGGVGHDGLDGFGSCNDLWKWNGSAWAWISGSASVSQIGLYGTEGVPSPNNVPGARSGSPAFTDAAGGLWLFGGYGMDSLGTFSLLNDLWKVGQ
jgi:N-acetylneuraminic acid mutarotase